MISKQTNIYIAGHTGMVGSAVWSKLESKEYTNLIGETSKFLELRNQQSVFEFYKKEQPKVVIEAAVKVNLGWKPEYNIASLVSEMMQSDLKSFKNN